MITRAQENALVAAVRSVSADIIKPRFRNLDAGAIDTKAGPDDLVTEADKAAEIALTAAARDILPGCAVVGEEAVSADRTILGQIASAQTCVIIDPIDGTWNYAKGVGIYGVILAVVQNGETVFGLLYDPNHDDWVLARKGGGAWFCRDGHERRLHVGDAPKTLEEAFGFVQMYLYPPADRDGIAAALPPFRRTYILRCSCHEYRMLAEGTADFGLNGMLNPWDHAAGVLALQEAGGVAKLVDGTPYAPTMTEGRLLTAKSPALWDLLAAQFATVRN